MYGLSAVFDPLTPGVLFKSTDAGRSFVLVGAGLPDLSGPYALAVAPTKPQTVYVGDNGPIGGLYVSSDGGLKFHQLPNAPPFIGSVHPHPTEDGTLLVFALDGFYRPDGLFRSTDCGATFAQVGTGLSLMAGSLAFDPTDASVVYAPAGPDGLFRSLDGALTFGHLNGLGEDQLLGLGINAVGVSPEGTNDPPVLYAGTSLGPFRSDDGGDTFMPIHNGYRGTQVNDLAIDTHARLLVATINSVGVFRSTSPGVYQIIGATLPRSAATFLSAVAAAPDDPEFYVVASIEGIFRTTDGGSSWTGASGDPIIAGRVRIAFAPSNGSRVYAASQTGLYRSNDGGQSFGRLSFQGLGSIAVDPLNPDVLYVGSWSDGRGVFKSTNGGLTLVETGQRGNFSAIAIDPQHPDIIYAGLRFGAVLRSLDGAGTFTPASRRATIALEELAAIAQRGGTAKNYRPVLLISTETLAIELAYGVAMPEMVGAMEIGNAKRNGAASIFTPGLSFAATRKM